MFNVIAALAGIAMLATLATLAAGMIGLSRGDGSPQRSNRLMQARVTLQGITLVLIGLLVLMGRH
jgi:hypothetical protein